MRQSLRQSIAESPTGQDRYPKGSIVVCNSCSLPIYKLDAAIVLGQSAGRAAQVFKPVAMADLVALSERTDIDAGFVAHMHSLTREQRLAHLATLWEPKSGDPMMCPACGNAFPHVVAVEESEILDRAYVIELITIPPGPIHRMTRGVH